MAWAAFPDTRRSTSAPVFLFSFVPGMLMNKIRKESTNRVPKLNIEPWPLQAVSLLASNIDSSVKKKDKPIPRNARSRKVGWMVLLPLTYKASKEKKGSVGMRSLTCTRSKAGTILHKPLLSSLASTSRLR